MERLKHEVHKAEHLRGPWSLVTIGVARGCTGCTCIPRAERKKLGAKFTGKSLSAPLRQGVRPQPEQEFNFFAEIGEIWTVGVVNLVL